jgi:hypothetical protein
MTFIHIATSKGATVEMVRGVEQRVGPREDIEGLLVETYGTDADVLRHVTVWSRRRTGTATRPSNYCPCSNRSEWRQT